MGSGRAKRSLEDRRGGCTVLVDCAGRPTACVNRGDSSAESDVTAGGLFRRQGGHA
jgi:hypothetical protein